MELIEIIIKSNEFLEQFVLFRGLRFVVGVVITVIALNIVLLIYILIFKDKYYQAWSLGHGIPNILNTNKSRWRKIVKMVKSGNVYQQKEAIIESGNLVYEMLVTIGYEGNSLDEILDNISDSQLSNIDDLKKASKIKNVIVNDENYELSQEVAITTVKSFGEVLAEHQTINEIQL